MDYLFSRSLTCDGRRSGWRSCRRPWSRPCPWRPARPAPRSPRPPGPRSSSWSPVPAAPGSRGEYFVNIAMFDRKCWEENKALKLKVCQFPAKLNLSFIISFCYFLSKYSACLVCLVPAPRHPGLALSVTLRLDWLAALHSRVWNTQFYWDHFILDWSW